MLEVKNLCKTYRRNEALTDANIRFEENKIYGLLGRNGAGKTTLLDCITGRIFPTSGESLLDGEPTIENDAALSQIYLMAEQTLFPESMRVADVMKWTKNFYPSFDMQYAQTISKEFGLDPRRKVKELSTGYSSILKCVVSLSVNTKYVIFDEPVLGLDANHRELFYTLLLKKYAETPFTAIISTHLIDEVANLIEDVIIIDNGHVMTQQPCEELLASGCSVSGKAADVDAFIQGRNVLSADQIGGLKTACIMEKPDRSQIPPELEISKLDLQKLFVQMTNTKESV